MRDGHKSSKIGAARVLLKRIQFHILRNVLNVLKYIPKKLLN